MPRLMSDDMDNIQVPGMKGTYVFSAIKPENLGATEYTLVTIVCDVTGSVSGFENDLLNSIKSVVNACKKSPRAENLLIRFTIFNTNIDEKHGFKLLSLIDVNNDYKPLRPDGMTALFDATYEAISSSLQYSKTLIDQDFNCNGAIYIITDGDDNSSRIADMKMIKDKLDESKKSEIIESLITILIGINAQECSNFLSNFQKTSNLTQYVDVGDASPGKLAKLAAFVSKSISSQSQSLGSGTASQPLTF